MVQRVIALCQKHREKLIYLIFGVLTTVVNYVVYLLLRGWLPDSAYRLSISNTVAWVVAVLFAYSTNRTFVFRSKVRSAEGVRREFLSFVGARVLSLFLDMAVLHAGVLLLHLDDRIVKIVSNILVVIVNYFLSKYLIFKKQ